MALPYLADPHPPDQVAEDEGAGKEECVVADLRSEYGRQGASLGVERKTVPDF